METAGSAFKRFAVGLKEERDHHYLSRWLFLRLLGIIYLTAFVSLWTQIEGLVGTRGILPVADTLRAFNEGVGSERYWQFPTFCWLSASDGFLHFQCATGVTLSVLLVVGIAPALSLTLLWAIYLSLSTVCREFLGFQWDILLLETGFLAIFVAPRQWLPRLTGEAAPSITVIWLFRWLLFRLMFMSGAVKLLSADPTWWDLTALTVHYETQPLPTWIGWHAHQMPLWFQKVSVFLMFLIELAIPALIFCGRSPRQIACAAFVLLMVLISITGNYCFFNLLTIALCLWLLDDRFFARFFPAKFRLAFPQSAPSPRRLALRAVGVGVLAGSILLVSCLETVARLTGAKKLPSPALRLLHLVSPIRSINSYGLFAVMTITRPEIVVEGSDDGVRWLPYEFKWKPGDLKRRPAFVAPHQPRLDWQMWFAALDDYRNNPWFVNFLIRLLQGSPEVLALLEWNPFPDKPPRYVRAVLYEYRFTDADIRVRTGEWWRRERKGLYCPGLSLRQN